MLFIVFVAVHFNVMIFTDYTHRDEYVIDVLMSRHLNIELLLVWVSFIILSNIFLLSNHKSRHDVINQLIQHKIKLARQSLREFRKNTKYNSSFRVSYLYSQSLEIYVITHPHTMISVYYQILLSHLMNMVIAWKQKLDVMVSVNCLKMIYELYFEMDLLQCKRILKKVKTLKYQYYSDFMLANKQLIVLKLLLLFKIFYLNAAMPGFEPETSGLNVQCATNSANLTKSSNLTPYHSRAEYNYLYIPTNIPSAETLSSVAILLKVKSGLTRVILSRDFNGLDKGHC